jgi:RNA polymerase-binding transcription factor DksA
MATAKKPAKKAPKKAATKKATKKVPAKKVPAKKVPAKKSGGKKPATKKPARKAAATKPSKKAVKKAVKRAAVKKPVGKPSKKPPVIAKKAAAVAKFVPSAPAARPPRAPERKLPPKKVAPPPPQRPPVKGVTKDGIAYTKDFDAKWLAGQRSLLLNERASVLGQAVRLEEEANQIIEEQEMGDVQFDDEGGEGDTMVVERERDLALGAQARQTVADIEAALERLKTGAYGYSVESARPIPRERLEAIPWATVLVEEKVGGIGRL